MTLSRVYIKFNNGGVFTYRDPDGIDCIIASSTITVRSGNRSPNQINLTFDRAIIDFYRTETMESGNGTEQ